MAAAALAACVLPALACPAWAQAAPKDQAGERKARAAIIALATEGRRIPTFHPGWLSRQLMDEVSYSDAVGLANARQITDILVNETAPPEVFLQTPSGSAYRFTLPSITDLPTFAREGVRVSVMAGATTMSLVTDAGRALLQIAFAVGILTFAVFQAKGRIAIPARRIRQEETSTSFDDVAGQDAAKAELIEVTRLLRDPAGLAGIGARVPKGILLFGPSGNGKTMLARAVANAVGLPFFSVNASQLVDKFVGVGAKRVKEAFRQARRMAPCVLFIDELHAVCPDPDGKASDSAQELGQVLAALLVEMDGIEASGQVLVIGATYRVEALSKEIMRPGRLDRHISVPTPTRAGRRAILALETSRLKVDATFDMARAERITLGFSGAELTGMMNEAALVAVAAGKTALGMADVTAARDRMLLGPAESGTVLSDDERLHAARHEAGHVVAALHAEEGDRIEAVTILPRRISLGSVQRSSDRDRQTTSRSRIRSDLVVTMGGRASEIIHYGEDGVTTGARDDIRLATAIARDYVMTDGLDEEMGVISLDQGIDVPGSWPTRALSDTAGQRVKLMLDRALEDAKKTVVDHPDEVACLVAGLLEAETLTGEEIDRMMTELASGDRSAPTEGEMRAVLAATSPHGPRGTGLSGPSGKEG